MTKRQITLNFEIEDMPVEDIERLTQNFTAGILALQAVYAQKQAEAMQSVEKAFQPVEVAAATEGPQLYPVAQRRVVCYKPDPVVIPAPPTPEESRIRREALRKPSTWKRVSSWLRGEVAALKSSAYQNRHEIIAGLATGLLFLLGVVFSAGLGK